MFDHLEIEKRYITSNAPRIPPSQLGGLDAWRVGGLEGNFVENLSKIPHGRAVGTPQMR